MDSIKNMNDTVWISDMTAVFAGGLFCYFFEKFRDGYFFLTLATMVATFGFGLAIISELLQGLFLFNAAIFIGIAHGICWVVPPQIILAYGGPTNLSLTWGFVLLSNFCGTFLFNL